MNWKNIFRFLLIMVMLCVLSVAISDSVPVGGEPVIAAMGVEVVAPEQSGFVVTPGEIASVGLALAIVIIMVLWRRQIDVFCKYIWTSFSLKVSGDYETQLGRKLIGSGLRYPLKYPTEC